VIHFDLRLHQFSLHLAGVGLHCLSVSFLQQLFKIVSCFVAFLVHGGLKLILFSQAFGDQRLLQVFGLVLARLQQL
jgi:hypothetical protein